MKVLRDGYWQASTRGPSDAWSDEIIKSADSSANLQDLLERRIKGDSKYFQDGMARSDEAPSVKVNINVKETGTNNGYRSKEPISESIK